MEPGGSRPRPPYSRPLQPLPRSRVEVGSRPVMVPRPVAGPAPQPPLAPPTTHQPTDPVPEPSIIQPKPAALARRRLPKWLVRITLVVIALLLLVGGIWALAAWQTQQRDPKVLLKDALTNTMATNQVTVTAAGQYASTTQLDLTDPKNPQLDASGNFLMYGQKFAFKAYGSTTSSYFSYTSLPVAVNKQIAGTKDAWVQLRSGGNLPKDVNQQLVNLGDPRYQAFVPVIIGNFSGQNRQQLVRFLLDRHVYNLQTTKAATAVVNGQKVYVLPVDVDLGLLKIAVQSAALDEGYSPGDVTAAVSSLDGYKNASIQLYVSASGHKLIKFAASTGTNYTYSDFNKTQVSAEPQTRLSWQQFAPTQWQIEAQAAAKQSKAQLDAERQSAVAQLHNTLASYFNQNNEYPTYASVSDTSWLTNIPGANPDSQREPLATSLVPAQSPQANAFAYIPTSPSGKGGCDNISIPCSHYKLIATLSSGSQYTVQDP